MQVAIYARVSTSNQQKEATIDSQIRTLKHYIETQDWELLPEHEYVDDGVSGNRLERPALDRLSLLFAHLRFEKAKAKLPKFCPN